MWLTIAVSLGLVGLASGQTPESTGQLERVRRLNEIAAQKVEADIQAALRDAERWSRTDPARAAERLKATLAVLEEDTTLSDSRRETLTRTVKARLWPVQLAADRMKEDAGNRIPRGERANQESRAAADEKIARTLDTIRTLRKEGRFDEARRYADELARLYPDHPAAVAATRTTAVAGQVASSSTLRTERERASVGVSRDIERSGTAVVSEMEFPKDWKERVKMRSTGTPITAKEKAILQALGSPLTLKFKSERFEEVIKYLSDRMGQPIILDKTALQDAQVDYNTPVTIEAKGLAARTVLRKILSELGLTYIIRGEAIEVTTPLKAKETMVVRSYYLGDLLQAPGGLGGLMSLQLFGPVVTQLEMAKQINQLIEMIQSSIDPSSWQVNGGSGTIAFHPPSMSLVIKQSAEVHSMLSGNLGK
jgi:hypothetical protein